ncbi:hypothetical protein ACS0TY_023730 [Phlomoides rotata]
MNLQRVRSFSKSHATTIIASHTEALCPPSLIIESGDNLWDFTYVDNVAHAHICAEESLSFRWLLSREWKGLFYN